MSAPNTELFQIKMLVLFYKMFKKNMKLLKIYVTSSYDIKFITCMPFSKGGL